MVLTTNDAGQQLTGKTGCSGQRRLGKGTGSERGENGMQNKQAARVQRATGYTYHITRRRLLSTHSRLKPRKCSSPRRVSSTWDRLGGAHRRGQAVVGQQAYMVFALDGSGAVLRGVVGVRLVSAQRSPGVLFWGACSQPMAAPPAPGQQVLPIQDQSSAHGRAWTEQLRENIATI